ncbi:MAG: hypothetical protein IPJ88_07250 [Myxococcales bacterium]|nr:MAG: hypothetical protein IPJ88_07250 [Myxococcales bacterium]
MGIIFTFVLAEIGILLGDLDAIAPILTMFFLATYGFTNLACGLERWAASPSFRPDFRVPWWISLAGAISCFYVMSMINMQAMFGAFAICGLIFVVAERRALGTTYGDARHGIWSALVRSALYRLRRATFHPQNWRPNLLILGGSPEKRPHLLELGSAIVQERGIVSYFHLLKGPVLDLAEERRELLETKDSEVAERFPHVFYRVDIVDDIYPGVVSVAQSYGIGSFQANTVMLGWLSKDDRAEGYLKMLRDLVRLDRSILLVRHKEKTNDTGKSERSKKKEIHIWWGGLQGNGGLMLLIAFLLSNGHEWHGTTINIMTAVDDALAKREAEEALQKIIAAARVSATPCVILKQGRSISDIMYAESADADLAIMGIPMPPESISAENFFKHINQMLDKLPTTIMIHSARNFSGEPVLFDESKSQDSISV